MSSDIKFFKNNARNKRYNHIKDSKDYQRIVKLSKGEERNKKFKELNEKYGLIEYSLHKYVKLIEKHFKKNIDSFIA